MYKTFIMAFAVASAGVALAADPPALKSTRPFIWVDKADKPAILEKIETQAWAQSIFNQMKEAVDKDIAEYGNDIDLYLRRLPFNWETAGEGRHAQFHYITDRDSEGKWRGTLRLYLLSAIEAGVMYYLTEDDQYGQYSADILYAVIEAMATMEVQQKDTFNGGHIYVRDHLKEARLFGAQIPILYDFTKPFLDNGGKPYSLVTKGRVDFDFGHAQKVFKTYIYLALNRGGKGNNWPVLEGASLIHNTLALEDKKARDPYLKIIVDTGNKQQDSIRESARHFDRTSGMWPESVQYARGVANGLTYHMAVLTRYNPSWQLPEKYPYVPLAFARAQRLCYPNGDVPFFGDGYRHIDVSYSSVELAYSMGVRKYVPAAKRICGDAIVTAIRNGVYDRSAYSGRSGGASWWIAPLELLWREPTVEGTYQVATAPYRTDDLPFAGIYLQRNLSSTDDPVDGLMSFVGGAGFVHGHASGMNMELYGAGQVLGAKGGKDRYGSDIHENYYRIFAGHNTVVVNGESQGEGGWSNLKVNTVKLVNMEPLPRTEAVSAHHSYTLTSFRDDGGKKAEASQLRLMGIVRTSPTSGYYVDVFRSRSALPKQFHDYIYHGVADNIEVNKDISFSETPDRYVACAKKEWKRNRQHRNPGWHFFENVKTAGYDNDIDLLFPASKLPLPASMRVYVAGEKGREISMTMAPATKYAPGPYEKKKTPTMVIRQRGEAWNRPFAVLYEPIKNADGKGSIQSIKRLSANGQFCGFEVVSKIDDTILKQLVVIPNDKAVILNELGLSFDGTYAVVTLEDNDLQNIYVGLGKKLQYGDYALECNEPGGLELKTVSGEWDIHANCSGIFKTASGKHAFAKSDQMTLRQ